MRRSGRRGIRRRQRRIPLQRCRGPAAARAALHCWNAGGRRKMIERLQANAKDPTIQARIAELLIEEERYADADQLLDVALARDSTHPGWNALRAESALEAGDAVTGIAFYRRALRYAGRDAADVLWRQA